MVRLLLVVALVTSTATARAEAQGEPLGENTALGISFGTTLASYAMLGAGLGGMAGSDGAQARTFALVGAIGAMVAPTAGHFYAGHYFTRGMAVRLIGLGVAVLGVFASCPLDSHNSICPSTPVLAAGGALFLAGTIDDFVTLPGVVRERNARRDLAIGPAFGGRGIALAGRF